MKGRAIDLKRWKRREHFLLYRRYAQPFFSVCVEVDVTRAWDRCHAPGGASFFLASLHRMLKAANATEAFRLRIRKRGVWLHERVAVGTPISRDDGTFAFARFEFVEQFDRFSARGESAMARSRMRKTLALENAAADDIVYHSTLPWLRFTSLTNALPGGDESIPRIVFGKCTQEGGAKTKMPIGVEVHHALVDGVDVARFIERFQVELNSFE
ncbi:MAG: CatA-like O-acetyltransferase [Vicinamibacterales bacterium]|nr:CatA-like O-acetyltransferase [Vicinamibacterales bacterium]